MMHGWAPGAASVHIHASCLGGTPGHPEAWAGPQLLEAIVMLDLCRALNGTVRRLRDQQTPRTRRRRRFCEQRWIADKAIYSRLSPSKKKVVRAQRITSLEGYMARNLRACVMLLVR